MSDDASRHFQTQAPPEVAQASEGRSVTLTIILHPNNQIECHLPVNKVLAHGLLGVAAEQLALQNVLGVLKEMSQSADGGGLPGLLKKMGRR